jgi:hypothetical protein
VRFEHSDAWVLLAVIAAPKPADCVGIMAAGDYLNHAVMTDAELEGGLQRLAAAAYVDAGPTGFVLGPAGNDFLTRLTQTKRGRWEAANRELGIGN